MRFHVREFPDIGCVFFLTRQIKESWHGRGIAKARCSLRNKLGLRIYPALFVIRTLTANRKLNEWGARSCGCGRQAFDGSRKQSRRSACCNQVRKSSHTRQWRGFLFPRRRGLPLKPRTDLVQKWLGRGGSRFDNSLSSNMPLEVLGRCVNVVPNASEHGSQRDRPVPLLRPEL